MIKNVSLFLPQIYLRRLVTGRDHNGCCDPIHPDTNLGKN